MGWKSAIIKPYAKSIAKKVEKNRKNALVDQDRIFKYIIENAAKTEYGEKHGLSEIKTIANYQTQVKVQDYESFRPYIDKIIAGKSNILWPGKPAYFAKTSGTTSGAKYIPITKASLPYHVGSARDAMFCYVAETGDASMFDGKMIFLSGSPQLEKTGGILTGRLSGIVNHQVPFYVKNNQLPSYKTNCIEDWETKLTAIVEETLHADMRLISGIPSWVQMYFEELLKKSGKKNIAALFPNLKMYAFGGVNYQPYKNTFRQLLGKAIKTVETYPASEGFIAYQDKQTEEGLLLLTNAGIFYEFIPAGKAHQPNAERLTLHEVKLNINYAIVLTTNAGLYSYLLGDTVKFVSISPYRILVTGRTKHFISTFGEHVIVEEVEYAMQKACEKFNVEIIDFHVAPQLHPEKGNLPHHQWYVAFKTPPANMLDFCTCLDKIMCEKNIYYNDLINGKILQPLSVSALPQNAFNNYMKKIGKLGGQNKLPRLADNRKIADALDAINAYTK